MIITRINKEALMNSGQMIKLRAYGNEVITRRLVRLDKDIVIVCQPDEYETARSEEREPIGVGFHITDVISQNADSSAKKKA